IQHADNLAIHAQREDNFRITGGIAGNVAVKGVDVLDALDLSLLDYSHNVLLASDVAKFAAKKNQIGDELRSGKLDVFYDLYNL
uniref:hypothetical protein n=1 Tax=Klebsiella pneumoniae TaxID=573 RepID=UPI001F2B3DC0